MFSSRNIHFAVLGIILGASSGYILAFYQIDTKIPQKTKTLAGSGQQGHPDVSNDQVMAMFKQQLERDPNNVEVLTRYADFLSDTDQFQAAADNYAKVLK